MLLKISREVETGVQGTWTTGPLEVKNIAYNTILELLYASTVYCQLASVDQTWTHVLLPVSKLESF